MPDPQPSKNLERKVIDSNDLQNDRTDAADLNAPCAQTASEPDSIAPLGNVAAPAQTPPRATGAPLGNVNSQKHGLRSERGRRLMILGGVAKGDGYVKRTLEALRTAWEESVVRLKGTLSPPDEAAICTAIRWEQHALRAGAWLRRADATLTPQEKLEFSRQIAEAGERRDKALARVGFSGGPPVDPWSALDATASTTNFQSTDPPNASFTNPAPESSTGAQEGNHA